MYEVDEKKTSITHIFVLVYIDSAEMREPQAISLKLLILLQSNELKLNRITSYTKLISYSSSLLLELFGDGQRAGI